MAIAVQIQDERQRALGDHWEHLRGTLCSWVTTCCLRFVDPYADTVFNQDQIPVLIADLEAYVCELADENDRAMVLDVIGYVRKACDRVHISVCFIGD
jgi:hypothetical protein